MSAITNNPFALCSRYGGKKLHLGIAGSIACYKTMDLLRQLLGLEIVVSATLTAGATKFITPLLARALGADPVYDEMFNADQPFNHLEPGQTADAMLICPASANLLAKMASGMADDLLSAQYLAFSGSVIACPAMNPKMWRHPAVCKNVKALLEDGITIVSPGTGSTACGEEGTGRLANLDQIFFACLKALTPQNLAGQKVLVTLGSTREYLDGVRFFSNPSSGKMGAALATAAWLHGAETHAIIGPGVEIDLPVGIAKINVISAEQMFRQAERLWPDMTMGIFCAAVADYCPEDAEPGIKMKKSMLGENLKLNFKSTTDILAALAAKKQPNQKVMGFAAEFAPDLPALLPYAKSKLALKNADLVAANRVNYEDGAFGANLNSMAVIDCNGREEIWQARPKADIALDLLTWLSQL